MNRRTTRMCQEYLSRATLEGRPATENPSIIDLTAARAERFVKATEAYNAALTRKGTPQAELNRRMFECVRYSAAFIFRVMP